jgi:hypothetical protein
MNDTQDPATSMYFPFSLLVWKDSINFLLMIGSFVYSFFFEHNEWWGIALKVFGFGILISMPILLLFYELGVYKYTFNTGDITIRFLYGRKKIIAKDRIIRIALSRLKDKLEIHYRKSSRHSTRIIRIPNGLFKPLCDDMEKVVAQMNAQYR